MRPLLLALLAVLALAGESLTPEQQRQHEIWMEAMRKSQAVGKPAPPPATPAPPGDPKSTPEYQASEAANRDAEAERLRREQEQWRADREAREKKEARRLAEEEKRAREEREANRRAERYQAEVAQAAAEQAEKRRAEEKSAAQTREAVAGIVQLILGIGVAVLPIIVAHRRGIPQCGAVDALVILAGLVLVGGMANKQPVVAALAAQMWAAAWVVAVWRYRPDHG